MRKFIHLIIIIILSLILGGCLSQKQPLVNQSQRFEQPQVNQFKQNNMTKVLMIIAPTNFKDEEYFTPKEVLEKNGFTIETASLVNQPTSVNGQRVTANVLLKDVQVSDYEAVVFVGGPGAQVYVDDLAAQNLAKSFYEAGKVVSAICIAPAILAKARLLQGKQATVFPSAAETLKENGADYTGDSITVDGKIITGRDPAAAWEFGEKVVEALK